MNIIKYRGRLKPRTRIITGFYLTARIVKKIEKHAVKNDTSKSDIVEQILKNYLGE